MATNFLKIKNGATFNPQSLPSSPANGDVYYDSTANTFIFYDNGNWINLASRIDIVSAASLNSTQFTATIVQNSLIRITGSTASNLYGLTASSGGKTVMVYNESSAELTIINQSVNEPTSTNRINTTSGANVIVAPGQCIRLVYDDNGTAWVTSTAVVGQVYASQFSIADSTDSTKKIEFQASGALTSTTLTITDNQTTSQDLPIPNVGAGDSLVTNNTTATLSNKTLQTFVGAVITDSTTTGSAATLQSGDTGYVVIRLTNASLTSISGIVAGPSGQVVVVENQTGSTITINNNDAGATAANRILTGTGTNISMPTNVTFMLMYDATETRWMVISGSNTSVTSYQVPTINTYQGLTGSSVSGTYTTPVGALYLRVRMVGGGGGGGSSTGTSSGSSGGSGGTTTFGSASCAPGTGGSGSPGGGGNGGIVNATTGTVIASINGQPGSSGGQYAGGNTIFLAGGGGASSPFGGGAGGGQGGTSANETYFAAYGAGGGGGGAQNDGSAANGGGSGAYLEFIISTPSPAYGYTAGGGGTGAGTGRTGSPGGLGFIIVEAHYQ